MKKIIVVTLSLMLIATSLFAEDPFKIMTLANKAKDYAENQLEPVVDVIGSGLNTGLYAPLSGKLLAVGLQANIVPMKNEGVLTNVNTPSVFPLGFLYAGLRIPVIGIDALARGLAIPYSGKTLYIYGGGIGWEPDLVPFISTRVLLTYHKIENIPYIPSVSSFGANIVGAFTKIPFFTPFLTLGFNSTTLNTDLLIGTEKLSVNRSLFQMNIGFKLFFVTAEVGIIPANTISISAGFSF